MPQFEKTLESFEITSLKASNEQNSGIEITEKEGGDGDGGACLIATAAFGSEMSEQVQTLREIRDNIVLNTETGTSFMSGFNQIYYSFSPTIADWERQNPLFKETVRTALTPMLSTISILNYADADSEYSVLIHGIAIILMNAGIYVVAPTIIVWKAKSKIIK